MRKREMRKRGSEKDLNQPLLFPACQTWRKRDSLSKEDLMLHPSHTQVAPLSHSGSTPLTLMPHPSHTHAAPPHTHASPLSHSCLTPTIKAQPRGHQLD